jgi:hypothetical protein
LCSLKLNANGLMTEEERSGLLAIAKKYNLTPEDPEFAKKIKLLKTSAVRVKDSDVLSDAAPQADSLKSQQAIREVLSSAGDDPAGLFSGSGAGLMAAALGIGAASTQAVEASAAGISANEIFHNYTGSQAATSPGDYHYASVDIAPVNTAPVAVGETFSGGKVGIFVHEKLELGEEGRLPAVESLNL